jgi:hypothetical protein
MSIKLHYHPLSPFSRRVLIAFAEKQIPHELVTVGMAARQHRQQPYLSLNPYGRVPTLEEDCFVLFESLSVDDRSNHRGNGSVRESRIARTVSSSGAQLPGSGLPIHQRDADHAKYHADERAHCQSLIEKCGCASNT